MKTPDLDEMTPDQVREWGKELVYRASKFTEMRAMLIANCEPGRALHALGLAYNPKRSAVNNLVTILLTLQGKIQRLENNSESEREDE